jgi:hypothetical protein
MKTSMLLFDYRTVTHGSRALAARIGDKTAHFLASGSITSMSERNLVKDLSFIAKPSRNYGTHFAKFNLSTQKHQGFKPWYRPEGTRW